jgi:pullulanase/glycogen debranching enzyme
MVWPEFSYDPEKAHPCDRLDNCNDTRPVDEVFFNQDLFEHYRKLIILRKSHGVLRDGDFDVVFTDNSKGIVSIERKNNNSRILAIFNGSNADITLDKKMFPGKRDDWSLLFGQDSGKLEAKDAKVFILN